MRIVILLKDFFAFIIMLEFLILIFEPKHIIVVSDFIMLLLPFGISSLVWNEKLFMSMIANENSLYAKGKLTYFSFMLFGFFLAISGAITFLLPIKNLF